MNVNELKSLNPIKLFYMVLAVVAILIYISWGISFGVWWDSGLYSIVIIFLGFGITGTLLYSKKNEIV